MIARSLIFRAFRQPTSLRREMGNPLNVPDRPASPPAPVRWKMAVTTWAGLFPLVVVFGYAFRPFGLPPLLEQALSTMLIVVTLTWVVMPLLTRLMSRWLHPDRDRVRRGN